MKSTKKVKIFLAGDSITEGDGNPSAYRFQLFKNLYRAGADFTFVGPNTSGDIRLPEPYRAHGAYCGYIIGSDELEKNSLRYKLTLPEYREAVKEADILCLWIGFNDYNRQLTEGMRERFLALLDCFYEVNPTMTVYCATLYGGPKGGVSKSYFNDFLYALDMDAYNREKGRDIRLVDACKPEYRLFQGTDDFPEDDGHPTEKGNVKLGRMWADAIIGQVLEINRMGGEEDTRVRVTGIETDFRNLVLRPNEGKTFHARVLPENAEVNTIFYSSSDPEIVSIDDYGKVVAHKEGEVILRAETLDGGFVSRATITVAGDSLDYGEGLDYVMREDFSTTDLWEGPTELILPQYKKLSFRWNTVADGTLTSKATYKLGNTVYYEMLYWTANDRTRSRDRFFSITVGGIELRISGGAKYAALYENGNLLFEDETLPPVQMRNRYAVLHDGENVSLYCNNELLGTAKVAPPPKTSGIDINFGRLNHKTYVTDLAIKTK